MDEEGQSLALDANGDVYIVGLISGTATFGATTLNMPTGNSNVLILKLAGAWRAGPRAMAWFLTLWALACM